MTVPSLAKQTEQAGKTEKRLGHSIKTAKPQSQREDHVNNNNNNYDKLQHKCTQNDLIKFPDSVTMSLWDPRSSGSILLLLFLRPVLGSPG